MKSFRERRAWIVGIASILAIAVGFGFAFSINRFPALRGVNMLYADLEDAAGLQPGNEVRVAGVKVGRVTGIKLTDSAARITLEVNDEERLPSETRLEVKLKTLLGQKFIDLQYPKDYLAAASAGADPASATSGFLDDGDVIPLEQTSIPFEIYQAANQGTAVLEEIDKEALRKLIDVLGGTVGETKEELRRALVSVDDLTGVLEKKGPEISELLRNAEKVTRTLAASDQDIEGILSEGTEVLGVLAERKANVESLLAAVNDLTHNLGILIRSARGSIELGTADLGSILGLIQGEVKTIDEVLSELGRAQKMFAQPLQFGRFIEGHACAVTTENTCRETGIPIDPGFPILGQQPIPSGRIPQRTP